MDPSVTTITSPQQRPRNTAEFLEIVKNASNDFSGRERTFFLKQSPFNLNRLNGDRSRWYAAAHLRHHCEIMLTLSSVKPCTLIAHGNRDCNSIFTDLVNECLVPIINTYKLLDYGFILQQINHPTPTNSHSGFQNGWIFADTQSPQWTNIKRLFLTPYPGNVIIADERDIGRALGYPINRSGRGETYTITYKDYTEAERLEVELGGEKVCCVDGVEYYCRDCSQGTEKGDLLAILRHFDACEKAGNAVGWKLLPDFTGYPDLERIIYDFQD